MEQPAEARLNVILQCSGLLFRFHGGIPGCHDRFSIYYLRLPLATRDREISKEVNGSLQQDFLSEPLLPLVGGVNAGPESMKAGTRAKQ